MCAFRQRLKGICGSDGKALAGEFSRIPFDSLLLPILRRAFPGRLSHSVSTAAGVPVSVLFFCARGGNAEG